MSRKVDENGYPRYMDEDEIETADNVSFFMIKEVPKQKNFEIHMTVEFDKEISLEEAESRVMDSLRNNGMVAWRGGVF